jgi:hypothetical protein
MAPILKLADYATFIVDRNRFILCAKIKSQELKRD